MADSFNARAHAYALRSEYRRTLRAWFDVCAVQGAHAEALAGAALASNRATLSAWRNFARTWDAPRFAPLTYRGGAIVWRSMRGGAKRPRAILAGPYPAGRAFLARCIIAERERPTLAPIDAAIARELANMRAWCYPDASEMPDGAADRCAYYARRLHTLAQSAPAILARVRAAA